MKEKLYTQKQLNAAIKSAYQSGIDWATCYISWFSPSSKDNSKKWYEAKRKAMKAALDMNEGDT